LRKRTVPISPALYFSADGLALGAGTVLLPAEGHRRLAKLQGEEARLLALLSVTYGRAIPPSVLGNIERAAKSWREGDSTLAVIHLAHAALPRPDDPHEAARRLFITDAFIKAGTSPFAILRALGLNDSGHADAVGLGLLPYEPVHRQTSRIRDCHQETGTMVDYKHKYWRLLSDPDTQGFTIRKLWKQALDQVQAAGKRRVRWYFAEKQAADYVHELFRGDDDRDRIEIVHIPMPEGAR
jgi:hypothetical protein